MPVSAADACTCAKPGECSVPVMEQRPSLRVLLPVEESAVDLGMHYCASLVL
jgi:hypothetical protein